MLCRSPAFIVTLIGVLPCLLFAPSFASGIVSQENPPADRVADLGGVVTFSGWTCPGGGGHHGTITMAVDGGAPEKIGSRLSRGDTAQRCKNDGRNGYAGVRNLGLDGDGLHTVRFYDDGDLFAEASYNVTLLGERFVRDAGRTTVVRNFPRRGQTTTLRWTEGLQTFVPIDFCAGDRCPCAVVETSSCQMNVGGSAAMSATVCNFCDTPIAPSTLRLACGGKSSEGSAGASLVSPGECREVPCAGCALLVPDGVCAAGEQADVTVVLTGNEELQGGAICCVDDQARCSLDRECCSGSCAGGACKPASCGNGDLDQGESCDGADLDGFSCEDVIGGANGCKGRLACLPTCGFDTSDCNCGCVGDLDCEVQIDCAGFVSGCTVFGACENGKCVTSPVGTAAVCLGQDPEFAEPRCSTTP